MGFLSHYEDEINENADSMKIEPGYEPDAQIIGFREGAKWMLQRLEEERDREDI